MCVSLYHDVWLQACKAQHNVEIGESNKAPQGAQEDLNSSIITESQASAMSPDCRAPAEFSPSSHPLSPAISLILALGIAADYGAVPGFWLLCYGRTQTRANPTPAQEQTHSHTNTNRQG